MAVPVGHDALNTSVSQYDLTDSAALGAINEAHKRVAFIPKMAARTVKPTKMVILHAANEKHTIHVDLEIYRVSNGVLYPLSHVLTEATTPKNSKYGPNYSTVHLQMRLQI